MRMIALTAGLLLTAANSHAVNATTSDAKIAAALQTYNEATDLQLDAPDERTFAKLLAGEVIRQRTSITATSATSNRETTALRIIGYRLIERPRESLWLAALAFDAKHADRLIEHLVGTDAAGGAQWYQFLDLPWPLRDRHWLIRTHKNTALAAQTGNTIWEHSWQIADSPQRRINTLIRSGDVEVSERRAKKAILLPLNSGAWMMANISPTQTLVLVHATSDMGGIIPESLVARYTSKQLNHLLMKIEGESLTAHEHYDASYVIRRGNGEPIIKTGNGE